MNNTANAIAEMMDAWNKIETAARTQYPTASNEEIYQITRSAMEKSLKLA